MNKSMNISGMTYNDLKAGYEALMVSINEQMEKCREYQREMAIRRTDEVKEALRILMDTYGLTKDEMRSYLDGGDSINPVITQEVVDLTETVVIPEAVEITQTEDEEPLALPESSQVDEVETEVSINTEEKVENKEEPAVISVFDLPALKAPYDPVATKIEPDTPVEKTPLKETEGELPTLDELLSEDPEYKAFYHPATPVKKNSRALPTLDELLSGEPINRILCLGNLEPKGTAYRQNTRICHPDGIIPTETASGQTLIYIPPVAA